MSDEPDVIPTRVRVVTEGGYTVRFIEIDPERPFPAARFWPVPARPRVRLNPVSD